MTCAQCKKPIEAGYFGAFSRETLCQSCYQNQANAAIQDAVGQPMSPMGDKESVATRVENLKSMVLKQTKQETLTVQGINRVGGE